MIRYVTMFCPDCPGDYPLPEGEVPDRVYIYGRAEPPVDLGPQHFRPLDPMPMDENHDYRIMGDRIRYSYSGGQGCWIIFQYGTEVERTSCHDCHLSIPLYARFCPHCGVPQDQS